MDVPGIVDEALDGEEVAARVSLGGSDAVYVTATRTLLYREDGLLSDESVESYDHGAERVAISEGRRKTKIALGYPIDGTEEFTLPSKYAAEALTPVMAGVLTANGVIDPGESVLDTYRFSELTLIVTSDRLLKHVGEAVWDPDYEEYHYDAVTGLGYEEGSVATQIVLGVDGRQERIKAPSDRAREVRQRLEQAVRSYHDLGPHEDIETALAPEDDEPESVADDSEEGMTFEGGVSPLETSVGEADPDGAGRGDATGDDLLETVTSDDADAASADAATGTDPHAGDSDDATTAEPTADDPASGDPTDEASTEASPATDAPAGDDAEADEFAAAGFESAEASTPDVAEELTELRKTVEKQNRLLARQQDTIEQLIEELRRGR